MLCEAQTIWHFTCLLLTLFSYYIAMQQIMQPFWRKKFTCTFTLLNIISIRIGDLKWIFPQS